MTMLATMLDFLVPQITLFHTMRNNAPRQADIEAALVAPARRCVPKSWEVLYESGDTREVGGRFTVVASDGSRAEFVVEAKRVIEARNVELAVRQARQGGENVLLYANYLSPRTRERIAELGANYADATGNLRIVAERPALFVQAVGADRDPSPTERKLASLKGPAAGRVVRALCDFRPPYGVRELAARCATPQSTVARVLELLDREALVERNPRGPITATDVPGIVRRWVADYSLISSNTATNWLAPRGLPALVERLRGTSRRYAVTASLAAARMASVAPPRLAVVYVERADQAAKEFELHETESGANVLLVEPFAEVVFERTLLRNGLNLASPSQVAADLLTSPGRGPAEAEALLTWMQKHEEDWRA